MNIYKIILNTVWVSVICFMFFNGKVSAKDISLEMRREKITQPFRQQ